MSIINLFPKAVGSYDLGRDLTSDELKFIREQPTVPNKGNTTSADNYILQSEKLKGIKSFIEESVNTYFQSVYAPKNAVGLRITQSWCNYTEAGQFHHKHAHPNSFISGVFYPQSNKTDRIYFYRDDYEQIKIPTREYNFWNSESWWLEADQGRLYIFPSNLTHMVESVDGDQTRISLSFNTFPIGVVGEDSELIGLRL